MVKNFGIMMFKKGNKVEVLRRTKGQTNSWFPGRITSAEGNQYIVKYDHFLNLEGEPVVEKVSQEDLRPQPPTIKEEEKWMAGQIVEVFDIHCWRVGKIAKVLKSNRFVIRLDGSIQLKEFQQSCIRNRQAWKNFMWLMIEMVTDGDKKLSAHTSPRYSLGLDSDAPKQCTEETNSRKNEEQRHLMTVHAKTLKREHGCDIDDAVMGLGSKRRQLTVKIGIHDRLQFSKQVNGADFGKQAETEKTKYPVHPFSVPIQVSQDSDGCSVGSCSSNDYPDYTIQTARKSFKDIADSSCHDAESMAPSVYLKESLPSEDELQSNVRKLEVHAYRGTLQALYASGPLSWEKESLLTNLRISLHISNEEHLLLLRQLLSAHDFLLLKKAGASTWKW